MSFDAGCRISVGKAEAGLGLLYIQWPPETLRGRSLHPRPVYLCPLAALHFFLFFVPLLCPHAAEGFSSTHNVIYTRPKTHLPPSPANGIQANG